MIEFTFMGRRYGLFTARLSPLGMPEGDPVPAVQGDLEAAGYQPFTRRAEQPAPTAPVVGDYPNWSGWLGAAKCPQCHSDGPPCVIPGSTIGLVCAHPWHESEPRETPALTPKTSYPVAWCKGCNGGEVSGHKPGCKRSAR